MSRVISAAQALGQLRDDQVDEFFKEFNDCMNDPKWVDDWRCGLPDAHYWRFSMHGEHTNATELKIRGELVSAGWKVNDVVRDTDRGAYTCYYVAKA
ncbi:hypothetical protein D9M71_463000 [compost metagenome]